MPFDESLMKKSIEAAQKEGAKDVIAKLVEKKEYQIRFSNSAIDLIVEWDSYSLEEFLSIGRKISVITVQDPTAEIINAQVTRAVADLKKLPRSLLYWGMDKRKHAQKPVEGLYDANIEDFMDKAPELVNISIRAALDEGSKKVAGVLYFGKIKTGVFTSYSNGGSYDSSYYRLTVRSFVDSESSGQDVLAGRNLKDVEKKFVESGANAGKLAKMAVGGTQGTPGKYDLIMSPIVGGNVLGSLTTGANPVYIIGKMSCLKGKLGKKVGPDNLTINDNALIPEGLNSRPFDYEGTPSQVTPLIEKGVLTGLIQNTSSAKIWKLLKLKFSSKTTANSYLGGVLEEEIGPKLLAPTPSNVEYKAGDYTLEEIVKESKKPTIYVTSNWYTRFTNNLEGSFSTIPRDGMFLIENGEIKKPVRKLRLTETLPGMLQRISAIGKDVRQINWWEVLTPTFIPTIKVADCNFTAATQ